MLVCCESFKLLKYTNIWTLKQENCSLLTFHILEMWEEIIAAACNQTSQIRLFVTVPFKGVFLSLSPVVWRAEGVQRGGQAPAPLPAHAQHEAHVQICQKSVSACKTNVWKATNSKKKMAAVLIALSFVPEAFDESELVECIRRLVEIDQDWAFLSESSSHLYIRPTFISTEVEMAPYCFWTCSFYFSRFSVVLPP